MNKNALDTSLIRRYFALEPSKPAPDTDTTPLPLLPFPLPLPLLILRNIVKDGVWILLVSKAVVQRAESARPVCWWFGFRDLRRGVLVRDFQQQTRSESLFTCCMFVVMVTGTSFVVGIVVASVLRRGEGLVVTGGPRYSTLLGVCGSVVDSSNCLRPNPDPGVGGVGGCSVDIRA